MKNYPSMNEPLEEVKNLIDKYKEFPVIVEGKRDRKSLESLGFQQIVVLNKALYEIVEGIASKHKTVLILTDFDNEGKKLYAYLFKHLTMCGVKIENEFRHFLMKNTPIRQIEGLSKYIINEELRVTKRRQL